MEEANVPRSQPWGAVSYLGRHPFPWCSHRLDAGGTEALSQRGASPLSSRPGLLAGQPPPSFSLAARPGQVSTCASIACSQDSLWSSFPFLFYLLTHTRNPAATSAPRPHSTPKYMADLRRSPCTQPLCPAVGRLPLSRFTRSVSIGPGRLNSIP